jgi:hypothetical protein
MITLRSTRKLQEFLSVDFVDNPEPSKARLGDWYANLVPTLSGDLIIIVSEKSLLTVAIPEWESKNLLPLFGFRVANILRMIEIPPEITEKEITHYDQIQFAKTESRSILGTMNEIALHFQYKAQYAKKEEEYSLTNIELELSEYIWKRQNYRYPSEVAKEILYFGYGH